MSEPAKAKLAIVAAMEREVRTLIRQWHRREAEHAGRHFRFFEQDEVVVVCGGIGAEAARRAAEAVIALYSPSVVYSVGFAGALDAKLKVGDILMPKRVVNAGDSSRVEMEMRGGTLVSFAAVADPAQKKKLRESFSADAVDMEAASVARAAEARGLRFAAVKVVSDEHDFDFPSTERFIDSQGQFSEAKFAVYAALRPWLWPRVLQLGRNSNVAARALSTWLQKNLDCMRASAASSSASPTLEAVNRK